MHTPATVTTGTCPFSHRRADITTPPAISGWLATRDAADFPYDAVMAEFHRAGKHAVAPALLDALARIRARLPEVRGTAAARDLLARFLDVALDKPDGRFTNPTYLALSLLPLPAVDDHATEPATAERHHDRLFVQLLSDAAGFEIDAAEGRTALLPQMRPELRLTQKRCRLVLQAAAPALRRLGLGESLAPADPVAAVRAVRAAITAISTPAEQRTLRLTMLPVYVLHDEYQFIRVLQAYEAAFALAAVELHSAVRALAAGDTTRASGCIDAAERALREAAPLFSLVATMRAEAFQSFREYTEGASAIQSRNYKLIESLCSRPEGPRLDSPAYQSVPEVRRRVLAGQATLDDARRAARLSAPDAAAVAQAMDRFAATLLRWRRTHHQLAVRMLGDRRGTGYTAGTAYLKEAQGIPVFRSCPVAG